MKNTIFIMIVTFVLFGKIELLQSQNHAYYVRAVSEDFRPKTSKSGEKLTYVGKDKKLKTLFEEIEFYVFDKLFETSNQSHLRRTWYVECNSENLIQYYTQSGNRNFEFGVYLGQIDYNSVLANNTYPNDYGPTTPANIPGGNSGIPIADLSNFDYIGLPLAFNYTTGSPDVILGIGDGEIPTNDIEFNGKIINDDNMSTGEFIHGTGVASIAASQGDNSAGTTGVCYDCSIIMDGYGSIRRIVSMYENGAKIINASWRNSGGGTTFRQTEQDCINEMTKEGLIIVAASYNTSWQTTQGNTYYYPASYENVISVSSVGSRFDTARDSTYSAGNGTRARNIKGYVGGQVYFAGSPSNPNTPHFIREENTTTMNDSVDIVAPGLQIFRYGAYLDNIENGLSNSVFTPGIATSPATPHVTGTVGLMIDLNRCLSFVETESILKLTSSYLNDIEANSPFLGKFGAGSLHAGRAVQMTNNLLDSDSIVYIRNQNFERWRFEVQGISKEIIMEDQVFQEKATFDILAKNVVILDPGTEITPNSDGYVDIIIDNSLVIDSNCALGRTSNINKNKRSTERFGNQIIEYRIYPTLVENQLTIEVENPITNENGHLVEIEIYNLIGQLISHKTVDSPSYKIKMNASKLSTGVYLVKGLDNFGNTLFIEKIIKK